MSRATELAEEIDAGMPFDEGEIVNELRRLDLANADLVDALEHLYRVAIVPNDKDYAAVTRAAALTSATKETT